MRDFSKQIIEKIMLLITKKANELAKAIRKEKTTMKIDKLKVKNFDTLEKEIADVFIVFCSLCNSLNIDLFSFLKKKIDKT